MVISLTQTCIPELNVFVFKEMNAQTFSAFPLRHNFRVRVLGPSS